MDSNDNGGNKNGKNGASVGLPLPTTLADWFAVRKTKASISLNDGVEDIHLKLAVTNKDYRALISGVDNDSSVEGTLTEDNVMAANMIRQEAVAKGVSIVAEAKLHPLVKSLGVVLRRYDQDRKTRKANFTSPSP